MKKFSILLLAFFLLGSILQGCSSKSSAKKDTSKTTQSTEETTAKADTYPNADLLVDTKWVKKHLNDKNIVFVDMREEGYDGGHIPGAVNMTVDQLNDPNNTVKGFVLPAEPFTKKIQDIGINNDSTVVVYDDGTSLHAARLFYELELYGKSNVKILNGGITGWLAAGEDVSTDKPSITKGNFVAKENTDKVCTLANVEDNLNNKDYVIVDTRTDGEYAGTDVRAKKGGHIPNAVHLEWKNSITQVDGVPEFKSYQDLKKMFANKGITEDKTVIPYCQTNVRGAHTYFTLRLMGYMNVKPYEGSWSEWGNAADTPVEK